jgi:gustatory receptor
MSPYNVTDGELVLSKLKATLSMTLVVFNVVLTVLYFQSFADNFDIDFAKADTIKFLAIFRDLGGTTIMAITLMFSYVNSKHMLREVGLIYQVDSELMKLNFENDLEESERKIKKQLAILLVVLNFVFNVVGEVGSAMVRTNHRILYLLVNIYPRLVITLLNLTLYSIFTVIQTRFEMINVAIYQKVVKSNVVRKYPNELDFSDQITQLVSIHKILVTVSRNINSIFSFQILLCITVNFVLLIGDLHTSMYIIFFRIFTKHYKIVLDMIKNCITYGFDLFYLARRTSELCNEANRTKVVLLGIKIDVDKENERNTVGK